jgi:hypothetical protein
MPEIDLDKYVHRKQTENEFFNAIDKRQSLIILDMDAPHWTGKTHTLIYLSKQVLKRYHNSAMGWVDFGEGQYKTYLEKGADDLKLNELYISTIKALAQEMFGINPKKFGAHFPTKIVKQVKQVIRGVTLGGPTLITINFEKMFIAETISNEQKRAAAARFLRNYVQKWHMQNRKVFIFMDNFCQIQNSLLAEWIINELRPALEDCQFVLGRADCKDLSNFDQKSRTPIEIYEFNQEETNEYLQKNLKKNDLDPIWGKLVHEYTNGNPMLVSWMVEVIKHEHLQDNPPDEELIKNIRNAPQDDREKLALLIQRVCRNDETLNLLFNTACILRRFDLDTLKFIVVKDIIDQQFKPNWDILTTLPGIVKQSDGILTVNTMEANIWESILHRQKPEFVDEVHRQAAQYYRQRLQDQEQDADIGVYERMHRYEDPAFQFHNQRWLYHLASLHDRRQFILESATRYFDAFFWWGDYLHFPFCDQLIIDLNDLLMIETDKKTSRWVELLTSFHRNFQPKRERGSDPRWLAICRRQVNEILSLVKPLEDEEESPAYLHIKSILLSYLAETDWIEAHGNPASPNYPQAVDYFKQSLTYLAEAEAIYRAFAKALPKSENLERRKYKELAERETWVSAWMWVWLVNLYSEHDDSQKCLENCPVAESEVREADDTDLEALARIDAARAHAHFISDQREEALTAFKRYIIKTVGFLVSDYHSGGDLYALEFFREMIEDVGAHLSELHSLHHDEAARWWHELYQMWAGVVPADTTASPSNMPWEWLALNSQGRAITHKLPLPRIFATYNPKTGELEDFPKKLPGDFKVVFDNLKDTI